MDIKLRDYDVAFEDYSGRRRYAVSHPNHPRKIIVAAPSEEAAIVGAAKRWRVRWQEYDFYAFCEVEMVRKV